MVANLANSLEINLRFLNPNDSPKVREWLLDPYVLDMTFVIPGPERQNLLPFDDKVMAQYINALLDDKSRRTFAIEANGEHVGNVGLKEINLEGHRAELFIEIGESEYRGRGVGKAAMILLLDYVFDKMALDELCLEVLEFNEPALRLYKMLGFETKHRSGWHYDKHGRYWQVWWMCLPKAHWFDVREGYLLPENLSLRGL
ncbi:MAG: GNAT family N-acetyltransferase [Deltaproteobacteria bacterium]|nr:GNAT family N-acetyltransferase [Deltaproteobacteria bacterium]